jgi:AcrR family transcriptional regulator
VSVTQNSHRRAAAGAAVLQRDVTDAIRRAVFDELAEVGYGRLAIEAVARRAGVGKTALYRRWPSKREMVVDIVSEAALAVTPMIDTGSLLGDVEVFLQGAALLLRDPSYGAIVTDLVAEGARNSELAANLLARIRDPRRARAAELIERAISRKEISKSVDMEIALDCLAGPLYWRISVVRTATEGDYLSRLARVVVAAITAAATGPQRRR